jgi:hypothetical protein
MHFRTVHLRTVLGTWSCRESFMTGEPTTSGPGRHPGVSSNEHDRRDFRRFLFKGLRGRFLIPFGLSSLNGL